MQDIKFRSYSTVTGRFDYFNLESVLVSPPKMISKKSISDDLTIERYTGLMDKKCVEIYEGDIIKCKVKTRNGLSRYIGKVKWSKVYCSFIASGVKQYFGEKPFLNELYDVQLIGNIHQNPGILGD